MTASDQTVNTTRSRRAILAGALGGIGAVVAGAIGRAAPVRAEGEQILVGGEYSTATSQTLLRNQANTNTVFRAESASSGIGVYASSVSGQAIYGTSTSSVGVRGFSTDGYGIVGTGVNNTALSGSSSATGKSAVTGYSAGDSTGMLGYSGGSGTPPAAKPKTGVYGWANQDSGSRGVWGYSGKGHGVHGQAWGGVGVYGAAKSGYALRTSGRIRADKVSGVATIAAGSTTVTVNPGVNVIATSFVLLTPQANIGSRALWYTTNPTADTITIHLGSSRSSATRIAWLLIG